MPKSIVAALLCNYGDSYTAIPERAPAYTSRSAQILAATDELYDLDLRSGSQFSLAPIAAPDDPPVEFYGYALRIHAKLLKQTEHGLALLSCLRYPIYSDADGHAWLTPFFYTNYIRI